MLTSSCSRHEPGHEQLSLSPLTRLLLWLLVHPWQRVEDVCCVCGSRTSATRLLQRAARAGLVEAAPALGTHWYVLSPTGLATVAAWLGFQGPRLHWLARAAGYRRQQLSRSWEALESWLICQRLVTDWTPSLPRLSTGTGTGTGQQQPPAHWVWAWKRSLSTWWPWPSREEGQDKEGQPEPEPEPRRAPDRPDRPLISCQATALLLACALPGRPVLPEQAQRRQSPPAPAEGKERAALSSSSTSAPLLPSPAGTPFQLRWLVLKRAAAHSSSPLLSPLPLSQGTVSLQVPMILDPGLPLPASFLSRLVHGWMLLYALPRVAGVAPGTVPTVPPIGPLLLLLRPGVGPVAPERQLLRWRQAFLHTWEQVQREIQLHSGAKLSVSAQLPVVATLVSSQPLPSPWLLSWHDLWNEPRSLLTLCQQALAPGPWLPGILPDWFAHWWNQGQSHYEHVFQKPSVEHAEEQGASGPALHALHTSWHTHHPRPRRSWHLGLNPDRLSQPAPDTDVRGPRTQVPGGAGPQSCSSSPFSARLKQTAAAAHCRQVQLAGQLDLRHRSLLRLIYCLPLSTSSELASASRGTAASHVWAPATTARLLRELARAGCVAPVAPPPGPGTKRLPAEPARWRLTEQGVRLLARWTQVPLHVLATPEAAWGQEQLGQPGLHQLWHHWEHSTLLRRLLALLQTSDDEQALVWWELTPTYSARWEGDALLSPSLPEPWQLRPLKHRSLCLRPDLVFLYRSRARQRLVCCELDCGSMSQAALQAKWTRYRLLAEQLTGSREEARVALAARLGWPPVHQLWLYVIAASPRRCSGLKQELARLGQRGQFPPHLIIRVAPFSALEETRASPRSFFEAPCWSQVWPPRQEAPVSFLDPPAS